jgi:hypothetical protein
VNIRLGKPFFKYAEYTARYPLHRPK